jgi:hypothetical protein
MEEDETLRGMAAAAAAVLFGRTRRWSRTSATAAFIGATDFCTR